LPGYVPIIAYLLVFQPTIFLSSQGISFDVFSSIIFIVAGPALGLTLNQFHRGVVSIYTKILSKKKEGVKTIAEGSKTMDYLKHYAAICMNMTDNEKKALDETQAWYDFCISTGLSLLGLSILCFVTFGLLRFESFVFLIGGLVLLGAGYLEYTDSYTPLYLILDEKYSKECK
jgi:hypothetical protein